VGRFASALAFLFTLAVVLASAGCGQRFDDLGAAQKPSQSAFASDALIALKDAGSAHVVVDAKGGTFSGTTAEIGIRFEGDVSASALVGDLEATFPGGTIGARVLAGEHDAYVRFMGSWYQAESGIKDALKSAGAENGELLLELSHLMADRTLRDTQLVGSLREAEIPRHGLESSQPRQGRKERRSSSQTKPHE